MITEASSSSNRLNLIKGMVVLAVFVLLGFVMSFVSAFLIALLFILVLLGVDSRIPYIVALLLLVTAAVFVTLNAGSAAQFFSVWSFYFLAVGILSQFRDAIMMGTLEDITAS